MIKKNVKNNKKMKHVKLFEEHLNEGLSERVQSFIKMCELVAEKNKKNPKEVEDLLMHDHGFSYGKLKEIISALEKI